VTEVQQGANLNVTVMFRATSCGTSGQCNLSIGFAFDTLKQCCSPWNQNATGFANASNANPQTTFTATTNNGQPYSVSFLVNAPSAASNLVPHSYELIVANLAKVNTPTSIQSFITSSSGEVGIVSASQAGYWLAYQNYTSTQSAFSSIFQFIVASQTGYAYSQAVSLSTQAANSATKATTLYGQGNFGQANTLMTQAMNEYQQAVQSYQSSASSLSGGQSNYNTLLPYGALMLGIGALVAGFGVLLGGFRRGS
jgi:hypothetical protein